MRVFLRSGLLVTIGLLVANATGYIFYALTARALGVNASGLLYALVAVVLFAEMPGSVLGVVITQATARLKAEENFASVRALCDRITGSAVVLVSALLILATVAGSSLGNFFHMRDVATLQLTAIAAAFVGLAPLQRSVLQGWGDFRNYSLVRVVEGLSRASVGAAVLLLRGDVRSAMLGFAMATFVVFVLGHVLCRRLVAARAGSMPRIHFGAAVRSAVPIGALSMMSFADVIVVRHVAAPHDAGLYVAASLFGRVMIAITAALPTVLLTHATSRQMRGQSSLGLLFGSVSVAALMLTLAIVPAAFDAQLVIRLLAGVRFVPAAGLLLPYAFAAAALSLATIVATYLVGVGTRWIWIPLSAVALAEPVCMGLVATNVHTAIVVLQIGNISAFLVCVAAVCLRLVRARQLVPRKA